MGMGTGMGRSSEAVRGSNPARRRTLARGFHTAPGRVSRSSSRAAVLGMASRVERGWGAGTQPSSSSGRLPLDRVVIVIYCTEHHPSSCGVLPVNEGEVRGTNES